MACKKTKIFTWVVSNQWGQIAQNCACVEHMCMRTSQKKYTKELFDCAKYTFSFTWGAQGGHTGLAFCFTDKKETEETD